jgi:hypothetical protein
MASGLYIKRKINEDENIICYVTYENIEENNKYIHCEQCKDNFFRISI